MKLQTIKTIAIFASIVTLTAATAEAAATKTANSCDLSGLKLQRYQPTTSGPTPGPTPGPYNPNNARFRLCGKYKVIWSDQNATDPSKRMGSTNSNELSYGTTAATGITEAAAKLLIENDIFQTIKSTVTYKNCAGNVTTADCANRIKQICPVANIQTGNCQ